MKKIIVIALSIFAFNTTLNAQLDRSVVPSPQPNPEIKINIPESMSFGNGMQVIMVENHKLPKVSFQLFVDYPTTAEGDKAGLSNIFGEMIGSGTKTTPKDAFDQKIDYMGADFFTTSRGFYASSLKKHTNELLGLIQQVLTEPDFSQEDFDRIISQNLSNLASIPSDASSISSNVESAVNYGSEHPYGEVMTETSLGNITLDDVKKFYGENFIPNNAYLVVVGDVSQEEVKEYARTYFEAWEKSTETKEISYDVPESEGNNVYFVNKPGAVQSVINITHTVNLTPGHPDEIKLRLLNSILGGGSFSARLMSNLREDKAYTYGCYSRVSSDPIIGSFTAGGSFRNEVTDSAIVQILAEIEKIGENEVTDKEIDLVKKSMTGAFARSLENPQTIARFALNTIRYNLPADYYSSYLLKLERITKADLLSVADKYLQPKNLNIIVVGNDEISEKLEVFDTDGEISYKNYYGEDQENLKEVEEGVTAETIFNQFALNTLMVKTTDEMNEKLKSIGQIEKISTALIPEYSVTIVTYSAEGKGGKSANYIYVNSPMGSQKQQSDWFDGTRGEKDIMNIITAYAPEEVEQMKNSSFPVSQIGYANDANKTITLMGIAKVDGTELYKIKVEDAISEDDFTFEYYDVASGMLSMRESFSTNEAGETSTSIIKLKEYKEFDGIMLPSLTEINTQGQVLELNTKVVTLNKKAKAKAFSGDFKKIDKLISVVLEK